MSNSASNPTPLSFDEFGDLIKNIERFYALGHRLSDAIARQTCEYLIQEASMAFSKTLMSLVGFLRFVPSSKMHAKAGEQIVDLSSASVMARQVIEDTLTFLYLSEPNLTAQQKLFRQLVWQFHGLTESIESAEFAEPSNPDLPVTRAAREKAYEVLRNHPLLADIEGSLRGRVRDGIKNRVVYDDNILERRGIMAGRYNLPRKALSNFAHFSAFSHHLLMDTSGDWQKSWPEFFLPSLSVAGFIAEALQAFTETFPETAQLLSDRERQLVTNIGALLIEFTPNFREPNIEGGARCDFRHVPIALMYLMPMGAIGVHLRRRASPKISRAQALERFSR